MAKNLITINESWENESIDYRENHPDDEGAARDAHLADWIASNVYEVLDLVKKELPEYVEITPKELVAYLAVTRGDFDQVIKVLSENAEPPTADHPSLTAAERNI